MSIRVNAYRWRRGEWMWTFFPWQITHFSRNGSRFAAKSIGCHFVVKLPGGSGLSVIAWLIGKRRHWANDGIEA